MDFSKALIRCHKLGDLLTEPRGCITANQLEEIIELQTKKKELTDKQVQRLAELILKRDETEKEPLSEACITYLIELYQFMRYGRRPKDKTAYVKQLSKGTSVEEDSLDLISKLDNVMYRKNEERLDNEFFTGIPDAWLGEDILAATWIEDIKSSWDLESFFPNIVECLKDGKPPQLQTRYWWQIQGYFDLTGAREGAVSFCLVNTPESLINDEKYKLLRKLDVATDEDPRFLMEAAEIERNMKFDDIPPQERRVRFIVQRDDAAIEKAKKRVVRCRKWLEGFHQQHLKLIGA
jgi:hypothetical protein